MATLESVPTDQISYRRRIGSSGDRAVYEYGLIGGLHLVCASRQGTKVEVLGVGSHPAIARFLAARHAPDLALDSLAKSETVSIEFFTEYLPKYAALTDTYRAE